MIRTIARAMLVVAVVGAMAVGMPGAGAQTPDNPNLDLTIDPAQGPPGTVIDGSVPPAQAQAECIGDLDDLIAALQAAVAEIADEAVPPLSNLLDILEGQLPGIVPNLPGLDIALFYPLLFVDIVTQDQLAESTWNPLTGTGQVTAPDEPFGTYAVVAACVGLNEIDPEAVVDDLIAALDLVALGTCLANQPDACINAFVEGAAGVVLGALLPDPDDPNIRGLGFSLYCLGDEAACAPAPTPPPVTGPVDSGPVAAGPTFAG